MDKTDLALCLLLLQNSRTPVRELAGRLGLSVAAVHARVQALRDAGIIRAFTARIGLARLQATIAFVWGTSRAASSEDILERLNRDNHVYWIAFAGAGFLYAGCYLRTPTELDACASFIVKEAEIQNPVIGLMPLGSGLPEEPVLDRPDCRIIRALHRDARKPIADIAEEIGLSAKTVGRRLARMTSEGAVELSMEWYPDAANDITCIWHLDLKPSASRDQAAALLRNRYRENLLFTMPMSNLPGFLMIVTWTRSMKDLKDLQARIRKEEPFERVVPNVLYTGYMFDTWRDDLLMKWAGPKVSSR